MSGSDWRINGDDDYRQYGQYESRIGEGYDEGEEDTYEEVPYEEEEGGEYEDMASVGHKNKKPEETKHEISNDVSKQTVSPILVTKNEESLAPDYQYREVTYMFTGSLADMAKDPECCNMKLSPNFQNGFFETKASIRPKSDASHFIDSVNVISVRNDFDASFVLSIKGVDLPTHMRASADGAVGAFIIKAGENFRGKSHELVDRSKLKSASPILQKYPERNLTNLHEGIMYMKPKGTALISEDHPVLEFFNKALAMKGLDPLSKEQQTQKGSGIYECSITDTKKCMEHLEAGWTEASRGSNLYGLHFGLQRAFVELSDTPKPNKISSKSGSKKMTTNSPFVSTKEICTGISTPQGQEHVINDKKRLYLTVRYKYKVI